MLYCAVSQAAGTLQNNSKMALSNYSLSALAVLQFAVGFVRILLEKNPSISHGLLPTIRTICAALAIFGAGIHVDGGGGRAKGATPRPETAKIIPHFRGV